MGQLASYQGAQTKLPKEQHFLTTEFIFPITANTAF